MAIISQSCQLRRMPFSDGVEAAGVKGYTVYNRMLLLGMFRGVKEDYHQLKQAEQVWDVACERQVELHGSDVSPSTIQGPKADNLMTAVFAGKVRDIRFLGFGLFEFLGVSWSLRARVFKAGRV